jgi:hypothetical protein
MQKVTSSPPALRQRFARFACLAALALSGCSTASYPSLARRDAETLRQPIAAPAKAAPPAKPDSPLEARLAKLMAELVADDLAFTKAGPPAAALITAAAGAHVGDEAWSRANLALAGLESLRGEAGRTLAEFDKLYVDDRLAPKAEANSKLIAQMRREAEGLVREEDRILADMRARLPR